MIINDLYVISNMKNVYCELMYQSDQQIYFETGMSCRSITCSSNQVRLAEL